jgi:hypothetical protein
VSHLDQRLTLKPEALGDGRRPRRKEEFDWLNWFNWLERKMLNRFDWFYWLDWFGEATGAACLKLRPLGYTAHLPLSTRNNLTNCQLRSAGYGNYHPRIRPTRTHKKSRGGVGFNGPAPLPALRILHPAVLQYLRG